MQAYALAILGAEYIARLLPRGTHDWSQFITPSAPPAPWLLHMIRCSHCCLSAALCGQQASVHLVLRCHEHAKGLVLLARGLTAVQSQLSSVSRLAMAHQALALVWCKTVRFDP